MLIVQVLDRHLAQAVHRALAHRVHRPVHQARRVRHPVLDQAHHRPVLAHRQAQQAQVRVHVHSTVMMTISTVHQLIFVGGQ